MRSPSATALTRRDASASAPRSLFGSAVGLPQLLRAPTQVKPTEGRVAHLRLPARRAEHHRHVRPEARRPGRVPRRVQARSTTNVPGIQVCEHLPKRRPGRWTSSRWSARSATTTPTTARPTTTSSPATSRRPGSTRTLNAEQPAAVRTGRSSPASSGRAGSVPPYVCLPKMHPSGGPAYLGAEPRPVRHRRRPERPELRRARPRAAAGDRRRPARRPPSSCSTRSTASSRPPRRRPTTRPAPSATFRDKAFDLMTSPAGEEGVRHPRRARQAPRRVRPALAGPVVPDGPPAGRGRACAA